MERIRPGVYRYQIAKGERFMGRLEHHGQQVRRMGFMTPDDAAEWLTTFRAEIVNHKYFPQRLDAPTLQELAEHWMNDLTHQNLRPNTIRSYTANLKTHVLPRLGAMPMNRITRQDIADLIDAKKRERTPKPYSRHAIRLMLAPLSCLFSHVIDEARYGIEANPCLRPGRLIKIKVRKKPLKAYTKAQEAAILKACLELRRDQYPLFCTLFWSGMRHSEAFALEPDDVNLSKRTIAISKAYTDGALHDTPKNGQTRILSIDPKLAAVFRERSRYVRKQRQRSTHLVFPGQDGKYRSQSMFNRKIWTPIVKAAGVPHYTPYATRHTYATRQLERGCSLQWLMTQMGHSSIKITVDTYGHLSTSG